MNKDNGPIPTSPLFALINKDSYGSVNRGNKFGINSEDCYKEIKGGAESGWDFSSRWIFDPQGGFDSNLTHIQTRRVIPVDLNAYLCKAFDELSRFYFKLGDATKSAKWKERSTTWRKSIELVLYDKEDGIWYDYDVVLSKPRKAFYPSNFAPLWTQSYQPMLAKEYGSKAAKYFKNQGMNNFKGGIPTSLKQSGEQWDYPNAWPPLQELVILGLQKTGEGEAQQEAETFAKRWIDGNIRGYNQNNEMFEKYDAIMSGQYGGGGGVHGANGVRVDQRGGAIANRRVLREKRSRGLHTEVFKELKQNRILNMRSDRIGRDIIFHKPYRVIVPKEGEDSHIPIQQNGTTWYTDGSKTEQSTGAGATKEIPRLRN
ncbi:hypothetical protein NQ318_016996 [Aromia moschata]|uniref:Trehalase n=1 Tax=Aromia moschata TaxID=1265417 RepID=A0AAV8YEB5_9CUCU|nr:hypothetical protein NQ318_016996 [Aromia moschata]